MHRSKIGIVEDEFIIACDLRQVLEELDYIVPVPCKSFDSAVAMLESDVPDLIILDIQIEGSKDGIELGAYIRANYDMPLIFLTANSDAATVERAKKVQPNAFLTKPFNKKDLLLSIEIALSNFNLQREPAAAKNDGGYLIKDALFVKDGQYFHKIKFDEILFMESDGPYVTFHTEARKFLVRGGMQQYLDKINCSKIFRVHRSYAVNIEKVDLINSVSVKIRGAEIPLSRNFRDELLAQINTG